MIGSIMNGPIILGVNAAAFICPHGCEFPHVCFHPNGLHISAGLAGEKKNGENEPRHTVAKSCNPVGISIRVR